MANSNSIRYSPFAIHHPGRTQVAHLSNMNGRLAGINTAIYSRSGGSQGIGFAIPSNMSLTQACLAEIGAI